MKVFEKKVVKIAVTGAGALLGQGILRALKLSGLNIYTIAVDVSPLSAGLYWANEAFLVPPAKSENYLASVRSLLAKTRPDILLIGTDVELAALAGVRLELENLFGTRILVSSPDVISIADDKYKTAKFFIDNGFPAPASALVENSNEVEELINRYGFPLVVKPRVGARSYGVSIVRNLTDLKFAMVNGENCVVQECVGQDEQEYTASGLYFEGRCDAVIVMRRDLRDGNTFRAYTIKDKGLDIQVKKWTEALKPFGPANFQFRIGRDGVAKVFEINSRFSGTTPLRAHAGFNEVEMCIRKILWNEPIIQPEVQPIIILRHWSETIVTQNQTLNVEMA